MKILLALSVVLLNSALAAQTVSFTTGPGGMVVEPTIPKVMDPVTGRSRVFVNLLKTVDMQGNGRPDILLIPGVSSVQPQANAPVRLLRPSGAGAFSDVTRLYFGNGALPSTSVAPEVAIGDFNRDGKPDLFVAEDGFDAEPFPGGLNILVESTASGSYADLSTTLPAIPDFPASATTADVNGDGILDIYVGSLATTNPQSRPYVLIGKVDGTFDRISSTLPAWLADTVLWEKSFTASRFVDVDNDGYPDLVLGRWRGGKSPSESLILLNDGHGDFSKRTPVTLPAGVFGSNTETLKIATIDANGDGYPDLLVVQINANSVGAQIQLLINRGDGTFVDETLARLGPRSTVLTGYGWDGVSVVDINGDGKPDIFMQGSYDAAGAPPPDFAWINDGNGVFAPVAVATLPFGSKDRIVLVDANGDGMPDLVSFNYKFDVGDLYYQTYFNTAVRTVPSEPIVVSAAAGNGQTSVAFKPPIANGTSAVIGYTATCRFGAFVGVSSGATSPLTVTGLTNGKPYLCSVTANSAVGTSLPSTSVQVRPMAPAVSKTSVIEYFHAAFDHYFITSVAAEIALLDARAPPFQDWSRTGFSFNAYVNAGAPAGSVAICRFFNDHFTPKSSHFYAAHGFGCEATISQFPDWALEDDKLFDTMLPDAATGVCPAGTIPVYRLYNQGMGGAPNHRFVASLAERQKMLDQGFVAEGAGIGVGMCAPE